MTVYKNTNYPEVCFAGRLNYLLFLFFQVFNHFMVPDTNTIKRHKTKMSGFINDDFLLYNKSARKLYHEFSKPLPIIDFHCHLSAAMIADDRQFENLGQAWLEGDHYNGGQCVQTG